MVPGDVGEVGPNVPRLVAEELRSSGESVIVQHLPMVVETVVVATLNRDSVTLTLVQVNNCYHI